MYRSGSCSASGSGGVSAFPVSAKNLPSSSSTTAPSCVTPVVLLMISRSTVPRRRMAAVAAARLPASAMRSAEKPSWAGFSSFFNNTPESISAGSTSTTKSRDPGNRASACPKCLRLSVISIPLRMNPTRRGSALPHFPKPDSDKAVRQRSCRPDAPPARRHRRCPFGLADSLVCCG